MTLSSEKIICVSDQLEDSSGGYCFYVREQSGAELPAFAIRYDGQVFAYINRCGHIAVRLDYLPGEFFSDDGQTLVCSTHGAEYSPQTGACLGGPCYGIGLEPLDVAEHQGRLYLRSEDHQMIKREQSNQK